MAIFMLGTQFQRLKNFQVGETIVGKGSYTELLNEALKNIISNKISTENHYLIKNEIQRLNAKYDEKDSTKNKFNKQELTRIDSFIELIGPLIVAGLRDTIVFSAYTDGDLNVQKLCNGAISFFDEKIWKKMKEIEQNDFDDCVKCLLTQNWTPAGIMSMRVIESVVREYYKKITGVYHKKPWGTLLVDLIKNHKGKYDKDFVVELTYIKDHIRNPLAHPELRIERKEAEKSFLLTKGIVEVFYK